MTPLRKTTCAPLLPAFAVAAAVLLGACDNTVAPFAEPSTEFFALFGRLDVPADTQFVRVSPIRQTLAPEAGAPLQATVTSTHVETGETITWQDSLVETTAGDAASLFFARFTPEAGQRYRLDVRRDDGRLSSATTQVPPAPRAEEEAPQLSGSRYTQQIRWFGLPVRPDNAVVYYTVARRESDPPLDVPVSYLDTGTLGNDFWETTVRLTVDQNVVHQRIGLEPGERGFFYGVRMEVERRSDEWRTPERNTVENGRGFFGAVGRFTHTWTLDRSVVTALGYRDRQP